VTVAPQTERFPMSNINEVLLPTRIRQGPYRIVLDADF
jgi:hypothetical protein